MTIRIRIHTVYKRTHSNLYKYSNILHYFNNLYYIQDIFDCYSIKYFTDLFCTECYEQWHYVVIIAPFTYYY